MKHFLRLLCLLCLPAASHALQADDCAAKYSKLKPAERSAAMQSCLKQVNAPANVQAEARKRKSVRCEQNAKNLQIQGASKTDYLASCLNRNEAAIKEKTRPNNIVMAPAPVERALKKVAEAPNPFGKLFSQSSTPAAKTKPAGTKTRKE